MKTRLITAGVLPLLLLSCASVKPADSSEGAPFSEDGSPVGGALGEILFAVHDGPGTLELRIFTHGPNPAGSPVSCGNSEHPAGTRLVPLYINGTSANSKNGVGDIDIKISTSIDGHAEPLRLTTHPEKYEPTCALTPTVHLDGLEAGIQHVVRGVAVVKQDADRVSIVLTGPDGLVQQKEIKV